MSANDMLSRRQFVAATAATATTLIAQNRGKVTVGLQVSALGKNMEQDPSGTLRAVAKMGYDLVEFPTEPYMNWEPARLKEIRATLDSLHLPCRSTRGEIVSFTGEGLRKTIELNRILGRRYTRFGARPPAYGRPGTERQARHPRWLEKLLRHYAQRRGTIAGR